MSGWPVSRDTSSEAEAMQIEIWRSLPSVDVARLIGGASDSVRAMALAGVRARHPGVSDREAIVRLVVITAGPELARRAYPEFAHLDL